MDQNLILINNIVDNYDINIKLFKFGKNLAFLIGANFYIVNDETLDMISSNIKSPYKIEFIGAKKRQVNYIINYLSSKNNLIPFIKYIPNDCKFSTFDISQLVLMSKEDIINYNENILALKNKDRILSERKMKRLLKKKK